MLSTRRSQSFTKFGSADRFTVSGAGKKSSPGVCAVLIPSIHPFRKRQLVDVVAFFSSSSAPCSIACPSDRRVVLADCVLPFAHRLAYRLLRSW